MSVDRARLRARVRLAIGRWLVFLVPFTAVAALLWVRMTELRDADEALRAAVKAWGPAPRRSELAIRTPIDQGTLAMGMTVLLIGALVVAIEALVAAGRTIRRKERARLKRAGFVAVVLLVSSILGHFTGAQQLGTGFGEFATRGFGRDFDLAWRASLGWAVSWLLTFAMGACLMLDRRADGPDAARRLRVQLVTNALLLALATAVTVAGYESAVAAARPSGSPEDALAWDATWNPVVSSMARSTASFYALVLAAKYLPAKVILEVRRRKAAVGPVDPVSNGAGEATLSKFVIDLLAILAPAFAELARRFLT